MCSNIFDFSFRRLSPPSTVWNVIGELVLPQYEVRPDKVRKVEYITIQSLSHLTGLTIAAIFQIFDEYRNVFEVDISHHPTPDDCASYIVQLQYQYWWFLRDEDRSGILHLPFRNSVVRACRRRIVVMMKSERLFVTHSFGMLDVLIPLYYRSNKLGIFFRLFCSQGWDIRIDTDLQNHSDMHRIIDLLHKSLITDRLASINDVDDMLKKTYATLRWLMKQFQVTFALCQCS